MPAQPKPKKIGRPKLPKGNAKAVMLRVRVTPDELQTIEAAARSKGQTTSEWIREVLRGELR